VVWRHTSSLRSGCWVGYHSRGSLTHRIPVLFELDVETFCATFPRLQLTHTAPGGKVAAPEATLGSDPRLKCGLRPLALLLVAVSVSLLTDEAPMPQFDPVNRTESVNPSPRGFRCTRPFRTASVDPDHLLHARPDLWPDLIVWNLLRLHAHQTLPRPGWAAKRPFP